MIVQHSNFNIVDEQGLELWDQDPPILTVRLEYRSILDHLSLGPSGELLYNSSTCSFSPIEISLVYLRAGYDPAEYQGRGVEARLLLEKSRAIKCPSLLSHLTTFKMVQQQLTKSAVLKRIVTPSQADRIQASFCPMYPLDESELGLCGRQLALDPRTAIHHVLKPSREGGNNNIYRANIPDFLEAIPKELWPTFILMEEIVPPVETALLLSSERLFRGLAVSELGIFGACMWRQNENAEVEIVNNEQIGWSFKTKPQEVDEMSVVKGYG